MKGRSRRGGTRKPALQGDGEGAQKKVKKEVKDRLGGKKQEEVWDHMEGWAVQVCGDVFST